MFDNNYQRRRFLKYSAFGLVSAFPLFAMDKKNNPKAKIVVIGGGFGGASVAKYLKKYSQNIDVTIIEPNHIYTTMPKGNCYLSDLINVERLHQRYKHLRQSYNISILHDLVTQIDTSSKVVKTLNGVKLPYDKLVCATGIEFDFDDIEGYSKKDINTIPHAYSGVSQLTLLKKKIQSMDNGSLFAIVAPKCPYRCPPGPYERASLVAEYFKKYKPKSKILIFDQKDSYCKQPLFEQGWKSLYGNNIERIDAKNNTLITTDGQKHKVDLLNFIPPQQATALLRQAGLCDKSGWAPVDQQTFASTLAKDLYIIGDSSIAGDMPKSGHSANSQAKLCAASIVLSLAGQEMIKPKIANTCYSLVGSDYGISVIEVYQFDGKKMKEITKKITPLGKEDYFYATEAFYAKAWHKSISHDIWG